MRRIGVLALAALAFASAAHAEGLQVRDVIELSRAGLGEEVLLALIEVDGGLYSIDPETLKALKEAGVPEKVIVAIVRSGRERRPADTPPDPVADEEPVQPPAPQVVVIDHREPHAIETREVMVPVPVYVAVPAGRPGHRRSERRGTSAPTPFVPFQSGPPAAQPVIDAPREPVYWGFGGKLRPDAWKPDGHARERHKPDRK